ncbi:hypothetical protein E2C01_054806 [Portunus trituberculatus]|uniref:Uncharacterized protein n=1 Tax=Portunus trituberculatus TaxID=210409 RepID=A0A5B7GKL4_PORTR|nr:hypothetical protein [Portunus trituberculatus]
MSLTLPSLPLSPTPLSVASRPDSATPCFIVSRPRQTHATPPRRRQETEAT